MKVPGKRACENAQIEAPVLQKRQWKNIKDYVRNKITANKRSCHRNKE